MRRHNVSTMTGSIATRSIAAGSIAAGLLMAACGGADESEADASPVGDNGTVDVADGDAPADGAAADDDAPESVDGSAADGDLDAFEESSGEPIPSGGAGIVTIDGSRTRSLRRWAASPKATTTSPKDSVSIPTATRHGWDQRISRRHRR